MRGNALFFAKKISKFKTRKIEKIQFFHAFCVYTQKNFMRQIFDVMLFSKNFSLFFDTFWVSKILSKKKKGEPQKFREKKKEKKIGRNRPNIFGGRICMY